MNKKHTIDLHLHMKFCDWKALNSFVIYALHMRVVLKHILPTFSCSSDRKKIVFGYMFVAAICMVAIVILDFFVEWSAGSYVKLAVTLVGRASIGACWTMGYLLSAELFPTVVR